ncbi:hypothetical protein, partial [Enterobacter intestinihominis]
PPPPPPPPPAPPPPPPPPPADPAAFFDAEFAIRVCVSCVVGSEMCFRESNSKPPDEARAAHWI